MTSNALKALIHKRLSTYTKGIDHYDQLLHYLDMFVSPIVSHMFGYNNFMSLMLLTLLHFNDIAH